ncbi:LysM peptidoglycan-binding domain-containing M23 family metallopeptidase [Ruegeria pomeroyi]|uniref:LysM peptidoglycan-binding domain-containing M23 family metallopeptidase n=1 Tax=Ruegeria pomeroyi TaxID=89184 RepID=A0A9Q3WP67_9RHOB|nr:peptidoglycan DD-metalloendopeptidase family protein [Ruegeria pomeroyi]MCE8516607.1 LysM peptidoglycan-binding domain-containing M23 family metallopeptidase [Ruegeria pomeroyi]MCE8539574.1 LysM peptidoglycan-binding domain-containing M23 family metallopeptidase [Ruegeria pomeroyi]MCE8554224.1 LysM peptidoglycan-binding domain-containing M23 family metallopeptidase [Ruegeria pomeroyi]
MSALFRTLSRPMMGLSALALVAACEAPLDYDLRGQIGAFNTTEAAQTARTAARPKPDGRGVISYPNYQVAVAKRGDTVASLSDRVGLPVGEVARFNGLEPTDGLREGEVLALPRRVAEPSGQGNNVDIASLAGSAIDQAPDTTPVQTTALEPAKPAAQPAPKPAAPEPVRHKVERGETAYTISRLYQVPVKALGEWNGLGPDFAIREGQYLLIPVKDQPAPKSSAKPAAAATTTAAVSAPGAGSATPTPPSATKPLPEEKVPAAKPAEPDVSVGQPTASSNARLGFPVKGKIVRPYSKGKNDGIDIAGAPGSAVSAAESGTVAAITADADQVPIVVIRHADNLLTVYANVDGIEVNKGDTVKRGQKIARLRDGENAYVHFEVRKGFDSFDPEPYLK